MPSKRKHTKTRHGCKTCRERRVRCDLQRPVCRNCTKRKIVCGYTKELIQNINSPAADPGPPFKNNLSDVRLMHHWSTSTYLTLSDEDAQHSVWQRDVPELAFTHEFLMYGIFAFTALHRARGPALNPSEKETLIIPGGQYKQLGLSSYIPVLEQSSDDNCEALFAFSLLLGSLSLAELQIECADTVDSMSLLSSLVEVSNLLSGCVAIADRHRPVLRRGKLEPLLGSELESGCLTDLPVDLQVALQTLIGVSESIPSELPSRDRKLCIEALNRLGSLYPPNGHPFTRAALIAWPVLGGKEFLDLMFARDTLALICLAFYGAILHQHGHVWFLEGIGAKIVRAVAGIIPEATRIHLEWALGIVGVVRNDEVMNAC